MSIVVISLFRDNALKVAQYLGADFMSYSPDAFEKAFSQYRGIVALMSAGIAVRKIAPLLTDKWDDPAVVVVSPDMRFAIPVSGGHHGANDLAKRLSCLGMTPVISTATECTGRLSVEAIAAGHGCEILNKGSTRYVNASMLDSDVPVCVLNCPCIAIAGPGVSVMLRSGEYVVGVGCNRGTCKEEITGAIRSALDQVSAGTGSVLAYATTDKKRYETGLVEAIHGLNGNLVFLDDDTINSQPVKSPSRASILGLSGVAEPCALALSKKKELVLEKKVYGNVTVAIAK